MKYENIIFDLYGTLLDIRTDETLPFLWRVMADYYKQNSAPYTTEELQKSFYRSVNAQISARDTDFEIDILNTFEELYRTKGMLADDNLLKDTAKEFRKTSTLFLSLYDGVYEGLQKLKKAGKRLILLSNAQASFTMPELESLDIKRFFDGIFLSSDYGVKKPSEKFFAIPFEKLGLSKEKSIMVGNDGAVDIMGAINFGIDSMYVKTEISPGEPTPPATYVMSNYDFSKMLKILML